MSSETPGLRERTRRAVRAELMTVAMELFLDQGFEQTTIEQIASAGGLSRRSFFRYFASKDEILDETLASTGQAIAEALASRPPDEPLWTALRRALDELLRSIEQDERVLPMLRAMLQNPSLSDSHHAKQTSWQASITDAAAARLVDQPGDRRLQASAVTGSALACLTAAQTDWSRDENTASLADLLDTAMAAVHPLGP